MQLDCCLAPSAPSELLLCLDQHRGRSPPTGSQDQDSPVPGALGQNGACTVCRGRAGLGRELGGGPGQRRRAEAGLCRVAAAAWGRRRSFPLVLRWCESFRYFSVVVFGAGEPGGRSGSEASFLVVGETRVQGRYGECLLCFRNYLRSARVLWERNFWQG